MATTTFTITVDYNETVTDPDSVAAALDTLIETATSTPGILEEYGNPTIGAAYVARPIVITLEAGTVADVLSANGYGPGVVVVDCDADDVWDGTKVFDVELYEGRTAEATVSVKPVVVQGNGIVAWVEGHLDEITAD